MKTLTKDDFEMTPVGGGFIFTYKLKDGGEICLEPCMDGFDVARYDAGLGLIGEKTCTRMPPGERAGAKALEIANQIVAELD